MDPHNSCILVIKVDDPHEKYAPSIASCQPTNVEGMLATFTSLGLNSEDILFLYKGLSTHKYAERIEKTTYNHLFPLLCNFSLTMRETTTTALRM